LILTLLLVALIPGMEKFEDGNHNHSIPCNGSVENCDKSYVDVTFPETHNSHATIDEGYNFLANNHRQNISHQWDAGFRAFMLDVHHSKFSNDLVNTSFCHGTYDLGVHPCTHGSQNAVDFLSTLNNKMNESTNDVVTFLLELHVPYTHIEYILNESGLLEKTHVQVVGDSWPTLREMLDNNRNLVIFIQGSHDELYPYLHNYEEHGWITNYGENNLEEMNCDLLLGDSSQPIWHMNNWLSFENNGLSDYTRAPIVNAYDFLLNRSIECWEIRGSRPTFIAVDWWTEGQAVNVTITLNRMNHWSDPVPLRATTDSK